MSNRWLHLPPGGIHGAACALLAVSFALNCVTTALANSRACQGQEQRYEQIKAGASSIEMNAALFSAAQKGCDALVRRLLNDGASVEARDRMGAMPLSRAAGAGEATLAALFLDAGARVDAQNLEGSSALFIAAEFERLAVVRLLLEHGASVNLPGRNGIPPLAAAAYTGNIEIVETLLEKGADATAVDATGKSALAYAAGRGFTRVVRLLLDRGVDINARLGNDLTALMWAAGHSEEAGSADVAETIATLLDAGARVDDKDNRGRTALMIAAELGHAMAVEVLVRRGADRSLTDKAGKTARDLATSDSLRRVLAAK